MWSSEMLESRITAMIFLCEIMWVKRGKIRMTKFE